MKPGASLHPIRGRLQNSTLDLTPRSPPMTVRGRDMPRRPLPRGRPGRPPAHPPLVQPVARQAVPGQAAPQRLVGPVRLYRRQRPRSLVRRLPRPARAREPPPPALTCSRIVMPRPPGRRRPRALPSPILQKTRPPLVPPPTAATIAAFQRSGSPRSRSALCWSSFWPASLSRRRSVAGLSTSGDPGTLSTGDASLRRDSHINRRPAVNIRYPLGVSAAIALLGAAIACG